MVNKLSYDTIVKFIYERLGLERKFGKNKATIVQRFHLQFNVCHDHALSSRYRKVKNC